MAAARAWAVPGSRRGGGDAVLEQARQLGLPAEMAARLAAQAAAAAPPVFEVMPENWAAMRIFIGCDTQWRRAGMAGVATGLDYGVLPVVAGALGLPLDEDTLTRLRVIEGEAINAMAEAH